jgi:hypothetical protein
MMRVVELWGEVQFFFGFEGLMARVAGADNDLPDRASRWDDEKFRRGWKPLQLRNRT